MKWFIIFILTTNPSVSPNIITQLKFDTKELCREYVVKNYNKLNERVNKKYEQHQSTPNLYYCVNDIDNR